MTKELVVREASTQAESLAFIMGWDSRIGGACLESDNPFQSDQLNQAWRDGWIDQNRIVGGEAELHVIRTLR